jgi:hypothetical protein
MKEAKDHSRVTPEGRAAGFQMVRLIEPAVAELVRQGEPDERCKSCAGSLGTVPNGCPQTLGDFMKALIEDVPFLCHHADRKGWPCHAWYAGRVAIRAAEKRRGAPLALKVPWAFSPPDEPANVAGKAHPEGVSP